MLGEVLAQGLPARTMRFVAVKYPGGHVSSIKCELRLAARRILRAGFALAGFVLVLQLVRPGLLAGAELGDYALIAAAMLIAAPLFALLRLAADALKATDAALLAVTLESLTIPVVILLVCAGCWLSVKPVLTVTLLIAGVLGFALAPLGLWVALRRQLAACRRPTRPCHSDACPPDGDLRYLWANSVLSIAFLHLPFVVLPWYADTAEIGVYAVAHKLVNIATTLLLLLAAVFGPAFARASAAGDASKLRQLLYKTQLISAAIFAPIALGLLLAGEPLAKLFSVQPEVLRAYLVVLAAGHLINAVTGLSGVLLNMAGAAALELRTLGGAMLFGIALAPLVGPAHGALGLACLFSSTIVIKNLASYAMAAHYIKRKVSVQ
jgi:O-antigen/teichoic acid export membrane protein